MESNSSLANIITGLKELIESKGTALVSSGSLLKNFTDSYCVYGECAVFDRLCTDIDNADEKISKNAITQALELKEKNKLLQQCWCEAADDLNKEKVKENLRKAQIETANQLYSLQTFVSFAIMAKKLHTLHLLFVEIKAMDEVIKDPELFSSIDKKLSETETESKKINDFIEKSLFIKANASLEYMSIKIDEINDDLNKINLNLNNKKVKLECLIKTSQDDAITNGFMSISTLSKLINFKNLTGINLCLGVLETLGYAALTGLNLKINSDCTKKIVELNQVIDEADERLKKLKNIKLMIAKYKMKIADQTESAKVM